MQEIKDSSKYRRQLRNRILEAAMTAFSKHGIKAVKMDDIASSLTISKRTLYEIYDDKESLLYEGIREYEHRRQDYMQEFSASHHVLETIVEAYRMKANETRDVAPEFYEDIRRYPRVMKFMEEEHQKLRNQFLAFLERGIEQGYFREETNLMLIEHLFDAVAHHVMRVGLYQHYSYEELFSNMLLVPLRGFCTEKGVKFLDKSLG